MKHYLLLFILFSGIMISCKKTETPIPFYSGNCPFVDKPELMQGAVSEEESEIIALCSDELLTDKEEITQNLIGSWKLIGYGAGWVPSTSMPCSEFTFTADRLEVRFQNVWVDTTINYTWQVATDTNSGHFFLDTEPGIITGFQINNFCKNFMYYDYLPLDGDMHIYQKQ